MILMNRVIRNLKMIILIVMEETIKMKMNLMIIKMAQMIQINQILVKIMKTTMKKKN